MATGHRKLLEQLTADGMTTMFGNPGSSEEGLLDEVSRFPAIRYILGLQEAALVLMASGYAQATQKPTAVQLHCSVGLGNAIGSLYQAFRMQRAPLVVIAGEAGIAADALDAHMALDLVTLARPVTKYAARVIHPAACCACCAGASRWRRHRPSARFFSPSRRTFSISPMTSRCCRR